MIRFNFTKLIRMKGISHPQAFLMKEGLSKMTATKIKNNRLKILSPKLIEQICLALGCVPQDFIEWYPDKPEHKSQPLKILIPKDELKRDLAKLIKDFPPSKYDELAKLAEELKK